MTVQDEIMQVTVPVLTERARQGDAHAALCLGYAYLFGDTVSIDINKAVNWFKIPAENGDAEGQYMYYLALGGLIGNKLVDGGQYDAINKEAMRWLKRSADQGYEPAVRKYRDKTPAEKMGCYIATAVYGSYDAPEVMILRKFRDEKLLTNVCGQVFVKLYYRLSPPLAKKLKNRGRINSMVRHVLDTWIMMLKK